MKTRTQLADEYGISSVGFVHKQHPCQPVKVVCGTLAGFTPILTSFFQKLLQ
jgi:hypothetical protein